MGWRVRATAMAIIKRDGPSSGSEACLEALEQRLPRELRSESQSAVLLCGASTWPGMGGVCVE